MLHDEELSLSVGSSAILMCDDRVLASKLGKMRSNVVFDLVDELTHESNDVRMWWKPHEFGGLVDECIANLIGVEVKVEAHFESVLLVGPLEAWCRAAHESSHGNLSIAEHLRHLELVRSSASDRHESLLVNLVSCSVQ